MLAQVVAKASVATAAGAGVRRAARRAGQRGERRADPPGDGRSPWPGSPESDTVKRLATPWTRRSVIGEAQDRVDPALERVVERRHEPVDRAHVEARPSRR